MELARQNWEKDFKGKVRKFMVIGDGVVIVTEPDGEGFWFGEMEFGDESKEATKPTRLGVRNLVGMAHGKNHIVLLDRMGMVYTLGMNDWGQLGLGIVGATHFIPQQIPASPGRFTKVRCGYDHSLALTQDGKVWAWGRNDSGQVGLPNFTSRVPSMRQIAQLDSHRVVAIECGGFHSLALTDQGQVYGWGYNKWGQLSPSTPSRLLSQSSLSTPVLLPCAFQVTQISAGLSHTLLRAEDGQVFTCGWNDCVQLGLSTSTSSSVPTCSSSLSAGCSPLSPSRPAARTSSSQTATNSPSSNPVWSNSSQTMRRRPFRTEAFRSMDPELAKKLTLAAVNFELQPET